MWNEEVSREDGRLGDRRQKRRGGFFLGRELCP
jgi:hypothetical protein